MPQLPDRLTPLGALARGLVAGAAGTAAMTAVLVHGVATSTVWSLLDRR